MESERVELHSARDKMSWAECRPVSILADWRTNDTMTEQFMKEADPPQQLQKWCLVLWRGRQRGWQSGGRSREEAERKEPSPRQLKQSLMASSQEIILSLSLVSKIEKIPPHGLKGKTSCINRRERKHFVNEEPFMREKKVYSLRIALIASKTVYKSVSWGIIWSVLLTFPRCSRTICAMFLVNSSCSSLKGSYPSILQDPVLLFICFSFPPWPTRL